ANGLAIAQQNNRSAAGRHLNRSGHNRFGDKIDIMISLQLYTFETRAHPVRIWRDDEYFIRESLNRYIVESVPIRAAHHAQNGLALRGARPIVRWTPGGNSLLAQKIDKSLSVLGIFPERNFIAVTQRATI